MLNLVSKKIQELEFNKDLVEMRKLLNIAAFAVIQKSRNFSPLQPEYLQAIDALNNLAEKDYPNNPDSFVIIKEQVEVIMHQLISSLSKRGILLDDPMSEILHGKARITLSEQIDFALHMVEQNNIDFFRARTSHLISQPHDRIFSHVITSCFGNESTSTIIQPSALPIHIQEEIMEAFDRIKQNFEVTN